jgi:hypothetical protein
MEAKRTHRTPSTNQNERTQMGKLNTSYILHLSTILTQKHSLVRDDWLIIFTFWDESKSIRESSRAMVRLRLFFHQIPMVQNNDLVVLTRFSQSNSLNRKM